jgi:hypothetical protein
MLLFRIYVANNKQRHKYLHRLITARGEYQPCPRRPIDVDILFFYKWNQFFMPLHNNHRQ